MTEKVTGAPRRTAPSCDAGMFASRRIVAGSTTVKSGAPGETMSPAFTVRSATIPAYGAFTTVASRSFWACASRALASSNCAWAARFERRAFSVSRSAIAPTALSLSARSSSRLAMSAASSACVTPLRAPNQASTMARSSMRASVAPAPTRSPGSCRIAITCPLTSARMAAVRSATSVPLSAGPVESIESSVTVTASGPTSTTVDTVEAASGLRPQAAIVASITNRIVWRRDIVLWCRGRVQGVVQRKGAGYGAEGREVISAFLPLSCRRWAFPLWAGRAAGRDAGGRVRSRARPSPD